MTFLYSKAKMEERPKQGYNIWLAYAALASKRKKEIVLPERRCTDEKVFKGIF